MERPFLQCMIIRLSIFFLLFYLQCPQIFLLLRRDSVALDGLLYSLVVRPGSKAALLDVGNRLVPLLGKGGGEEPGNHHLYVILFAPYRGWNFKILCLEVFVQIMRHKHSYSKATSINV